MLAHGVKPHASAVLLLSALVTTASVADVSAPQSPQADGFNQRVDSAVSAILTRTGVPSASIAIVLKHGGEVGGFNSENRLFPDDGAAIVVFTNEDATDASDVIADAIEELLFAADSPADAAALASARDVFQQLQLGKMNTGLLTANARSYFTAAALHDFQTI